MLDHRDFNTPHLSEVELGLRSGTGTFKDHWVGALALGARGVVYGDIGTSPLYTMKTALEWGGGATPDIAVGMLSLIVWTLLITTSIKYVAVVMRADNDGEGAWSPHRHGRGNKSPRTFSALQISGRPLT